MSDTRFTASNGFYVEDMILRTAGGTPDLNVLSTRAQALIEYGAHKAQAERDAELGRWRSAERPDVVGYPRSSNGSGDHAVLVDETTGVNVYVRRCPAGVVWANGKLFWQEAAVEYFAAQRVPEPKPWEQAKHGEAWLLTVDGLPGVVLRDSLGWQGVNWRLEVGSLFITAGRRIWPEATHE